MHTMLVGTWINGLSWPGKHCTCIAFGTTSMEEWARIDEGSDGRKKARASVRWNVDFWTAGTIWGFRRVRSW
jgi:hypothetical protein